MQGTKGQGKFGSFITYRTKKPLKNYFLANNLIELSLNFKGFQPLRFVYYKMFCTLNKFYSNIKQET